MPAEAKGVLDVVMAKPPKRPEAAAALVMRGVAQIMLGHYETARKDLADPQVRDDYDAPLWRSVALAGLGRWSAAQSGFKNLRSAATAIPIELQQTAARAAVKTSIGLGDLKDADARMNDLEALSIPQSLEPTINLLRGRIAEGLGRPSDALELYAKAAATPESPASDAAQLRKLLLEHSQGKISSSDAIARLENLTLSWRGDDTEVEALQHLGRLYAQAGRYREALQAMRDALALAPHSAAESIQEEAAATFESVFLGGKAESLSPIDALSLFYDFRQLTPVGRRGDEMIRRLADRLVSVDLLNQAADLLQHQVDHRLQGAARAQVAVRLASVYLMARKPEAALKVLRDTRVTDLPTELRNQRILLEARALSDMGQHDLALEVVNNLEGRDVDRLRADIFWTAHRWREAGEQIEREYGERWRDFAPLTDLERVDILRGAIAYSLAEDAIGLDRFRERYGAKMRDGPDRRAFEVVTAPLGSAGAEFGDVAKQVAATSTLDQFLRELKTRYPDTAAPPPPAAEGPPGGPQPQSRASTGGQAS
jgi:tetratricopeptide (TPR) repeat protein